mgnify:CR=1 FL=1
MTVSERLDQFDALMEGIVSDSMKLDLIKRGFFTAPASTKYHGDYRGGLFDHSYAVARFLNDLTKQCHLLWQNPRSPLLVGMFHDLCKMDAYKTLGDGYEHNADTLLKGHGEKSVMILSQYFRLTEEEVCCIRYHMGAFTDKSEWGDYTNAMHNYPNVLWTHHADMMASHIARI